MERTDQAYRPHQQPSSEPERDPDLGEEPEELPRSERERRATAWEIIETILLALLIFLMVRGVVLNFRVDGNSMEPTLTNSEMLIVNRRAYSSVDLDSLLNALPGVDRQPGDERYIFNPPRRGDIVVFRPPGSQSEPYIKRIIGLPGETVEIRDGAVFIDGAKLDEPYVTSSTSWRGNGGESTITIPEDEYFMLGDNRSNSSDSRVFGTVPKANIIGKSWIAYWPPGSIEVLPRPSYAQE